MRIKNQDIFRLLNVYFIFGVMFIVFAIFVPHFLTVRNMINIGRLTTIRVILVIGMTFVVITGNFDLSSEGQIACIAMIIGVLIKKAGMGVDWAFIIAPLIGAGFGLFNGYFSTKIPSFIVTLGTLVITRGLALIVNNNRAVAIFPQSLLIVARREVFGIPILFIYTIIVVSIATFVARYTLFGRYMYAVGGNREAARVCALPVNRIIIKVFILNGILCGICALLLMAKINSAHPLVMEGESLNAITAVVIGGASLWGGVGTVLGSVTGAGLISLLSVSFNLLGVRSAYKRVVLGIVLISVVMFGYLRGKSGEK